MSKQHSSFLSVFLFIIFVIFAGILLFSDQDNSDIHQFNKISGIDLLECMSAGKNLDTCMKNKNLTKTELFLIDDAHKYCLENFPDSNVNDPAVIFCLDQILMNYPLYSGQGYFKSITYCLHEGNTFDYCVAREKLNDIEQKELITLYNDCGSFYPKINFLRCIDTSILRSRINEVLNDSIFNLFVNKLNGRHFSIKIKTLDGKDLQLNNVDEITVVSSDKSLLTIEEVANLDVANLKGDVVWSCEDIAIHTVDVHGTKNIITGVRSVHIADPIAEIVSISAPTGIRRGAEFFIQLKSIPPNSKLQCKILRSDEELDLNNYDDSEVVFAEEVKSGAVRWIPPADIQYGKYYYVLEDMNSNLPVYSDYFEIVEN